MTFSQLVKEELLVQDIESETAKIELMATFKSIGILEMNSAGVIIEIKTAQIKLTKRVLEIIKHEYPNSIVQTMVRNARNFNHSNKLYVIKIEQGAREILYDLKLIDSKENKMIFRLNDCIKNLKSDEERRVYTRMYFCCTGSVNDPKVAQQYHLEILGSNEEYLQEITKMVKKYGIIFKKTTRKYNKAIYLNKSEEIADFLKFVKSNYMLFEFEDYRMIRDIRLINNRLNNADIANEMRKMSSTQKHLDAIQILKDNNLFDELGTKTIEIANLRMEYPNDSLQELAEHSQNKISKSNVTYHLKLIVKKSELLTD